MRIYLATWLFEKSQENALNKIRKKERLLSFYHVILHLKKEKYAFEDYIKLRK